MIIEFKLKNHLIPALIDEEDLNLILSHNKLWAKDTIGYAQAFSYTLKKVVKMHQIIPLNGKKNGLIIDHINKNKIHNYKANLRLVTYSQNAMVSNENWHLKTSKYRGVHLCSSSIKKWKVTVRGNIKQIHIGYFADEIEAAKAYNKAALFYNKNFAILNQI